MTIIAGLAAAIVAAAAGALAMTFLDARSAPPIIIADPEASIVVSVEGAVMNPGVYRLPRDARVNDAVLAAGGLNANADLATVNLAARLRDGQRLVVPAESNEPENFASSPAASRAAALPQTSTININTASIEELDALPGIGPAKAQAIIDYRTAHGPFRSVDELVLVDGISLAMLERLRPLISV